MVAPSALVNEALGDFRARQPARAVTVGDVRWEYIACGAGHTLAMIKPGEFASPVRESYDER